MALPSQKNLQIYRGDTFTVIFRLRDTHGAGVDLTGATPTSQIRASVGGSVLATFTCALQDQTTTPGGVTLLLSAATTAALAPVTGAVWDVQLLYPDTSVKTYLAGEVAIVGDVTHA